jgi:hypothetical protein
MACMTNSVVSEPSEWSTLLIWSSVPLVGNHDGYVPNVGKAGVLGCAAEATPGPSISAAAMAAPPSDDATAKRFRSLRNLMISGFSFVVVALALMRPFRGVA